MPDSRHPGILVAALIIVRSAAALAGPFQEAQKPAAALTYVGTETCQPCHDDIFKVHQKSPHLAIESRKKLGFEGKSCESCHGPGSKHAESLSPEDIRNPAKQAPAEADKTCLQCHLNQPTHAGRIQSSHAKNQVSCAGCHPIHQKGPAGLVVRKAADINALCARCHASASNQFQRPFRHRLPEGVMSCVDCHNPHGSFRPEMMRTTAANEPGCYKCHTDKRGPFTFEHAPVRLEGCGSCHEPHGSSNPKMLTRQEARLVCLECHAGLPQSAPGTTQSAIGVVPPAFHDLRTPRYRNCTICHQKVHGSHVDRNFLR
jgi:DmsE family decaheme c-type cytochrome